MKLEFPSCLPITEKIPEFLQLLSRYPVVILTGSTGSGKTTQIPKALLKAKYGERGLIVHTQPRRIAARNVAFRLAEECETPLGTGAVGYAVRFEERSSVNNQVQVVTDGLLLNWLSQENFLKKVSVIVLDEAHERSVNIDLLMGLLKSLLKKNPRLKLIVMSATIQTEVFSKFFDNAPILECHARAYPIDIHYLPHSSGQDKFQYLAQTIKTLLEKAPGDFLVFCSGEGEIRKAAQVLREAFSGFEILPLYARLKVQDQQKIFSFSQRRRIILATNIAETSLTVPNIRFVLDFGEARVSRYNPRTNIQCLPVEAIAKANCDQRAGRAGRLGPGTCIRFYSEEDYQLRPSFLDPELLRTNLAQVILQLLSMGISKPEHFPWIDQPTEALLRQGWRTLEYLGAVTENRILTELGVKIAKLPVDPSLGRIILASVQYHCVQEALIVVSALEVPHILENTQEQVILERRVHAFLDDHSDFKSIVQLWNFLHEQKTAHTNQGYKKVLKALGIQEPKIREWSQAYRQLLHIVGAVSIRLNNTPCQSSDLHKALLTGMLGGVGFKDVKGNYQGLRQLSFVLAKPYPKELKKASWVMAFELIETSKVYARMVARIEPEWIEEVAKPLLKVHYGTPFWHARTRRAVVSLRLSLFGLTIISGRKIDCSKQDPELARTLMIEEGLVGGQFDSKHPFFAHNQHYLLEQEKMEERFRQSGYAVDEDLQRAFYEQRIPKTVVSGKTLEEWLKTVPTETLFFNKEAFETKKLDLLEKEKEFPTEVIILGVSLKVRYCFQPGSNKDGVTFLIPKALVNRFKTEDFSWLVPGLLQERISALLKTLPKPKRRAVLPVHAFSQALLERCTLGVGNLLDQLAALLSAMTGQVIFVADFREEDIPEHLRARFEIISQEGTVLTAGRSLEQESLASEAPLALRENKQNRFFTTWEWEEIPSTVSRVIAGVKVPLYVALVEEGEAVIVGELEDPINALFLHRFGVLRLIRCALKMQEESCKKQLRRVPASLQLGRLFNFDLLLDLWITLLFQDVFGEEAKNIYSQDAFKKVVEQKKGLLMVKLQELLGVLPVLSEMAVKADAEYQRKKKLLPSQLIEDVARQWGFLFSQATWKQSSIAQYKRVPVYVAALHKRLEKALLDPRREALQYAQLKLLEEKYEHYRKQKPKSLEQQVFLGQFCWLLQELRVSLFAEQLGALGGVSVKKLTASLEQYQSILH